jgi:hypothetical protein
MQEIKVYIAFDGDKIGRKVGQASLNDKPDELRRLSQAIDKGNEIWKAWALAAGGSAISLGGDEGRLEIPASKLEDLPKIRQEYMMAVGSSVSVGIGQKLSEAEKSLVVAKIRGGNQVVLYTPEVEQEMEKNLAPKPDSEVDKLAQAYMKSERMRKSEPLPAARMPEPPKAPWTPEGLHPDMHPIAYLESNYGRNLNHTKNPAGPMHTAVGALGMKPVAALQEYVNNPELRGSYPNLNGNDGMFRRALEGNHTFYNAVASALWDRLKRNLGNHKHRAAFAWRWGYDKTKQSLESDILRDPYVNKFLSLTKGMKEHMSLYKHELDFMPSRLIKAFQPTDGSVLESEDGEVTSPAAGGGISPPAQAPAQQEGSSAGFNAAPEHSEGEAAQNYFAQNAPGSPEATHNQSDIEGMMHQSAAEGHAQDHEEEVNNKEAQQKDDHKQDLKEEIVKVLQQFKQQAPVIEQLKEQAPDLYQSITQVMQAFVALAQEVVGGDDASQQEDSSEDASGSESGESEEAPAEASSESDKESSESSDTKKYEKLVLLKEKLAKIEGLMKASKGNWHGAEKVCARCKRGDHDECIEIVNDRGPGHNAWTAGDKLTRVCECNHKPLGKVAPPATHHHVTLPVGSQLAPEGKVKVQHLETGVTGKKTTPAKTGWIQARAGQVLSNDGHPISSRNPGGR